MRWKTTSQPSVSGTDACKLASLNELPQATFDMLCWTIVWIATVSTVQKSVS